MFSFGKGKLWSPCYQMDSYDINKYGSPGISVRARLGLEILRKCRINTEISTWRKIRRGSMVDLHTRFKLGSKFHMFCT
jgi:hypothetical protein